MQQWKHFSCVWSLRGGGTLTRREHTLWTIINTWGEGARVTDDVPFGMIFPTSVVQSSNEDGEWGRASRQVLGEYEEDERSFQDANGRQLDLEIDPGFNLQQ